MGNLGCRLPISGGNVYIAGRIANIFYEQRHTQVHIVIADAEARIEYLVTTLIPVVARART